MFYWFKLKNKIVNDFQKYNLVNRVQVKKPIKKVELKGLCVKVEEICT